MWQWVKSDCGWQPANMFPSAVEWLQARAGRHVDWLEDGSKYVNVRFDSRTGAFLIRHDKDGRVLMLVED